MSIPIAGSETHLNGNSALYYQNRVGGRALFPPSPSEGPFIQRSQDLHDEVWENFLLKKNRRPEASCVLYRAEEQKGETRGANFPANLNNKRSKNKAKAEPSGLTRKRKLLGHYCTCVRETRKSESGVDTCAKVHSTNVAVTTALPIVDDYQAASAAPPSYPCSYRLSRS